MDHLAQQLSNVTMYDVKSSFRKAQNAVFNFSDMEAKVREATNNDPWGTPTSLMQKIADGTNNYQQFHEIMPFIYRRFTEKSAHSWRQIYKAVQLLDYLVKNGSERVVDYARSHIAVIEIIRFFSYVDSKGVDRGAAIRHRAEELIQLLNSTDKLRAERKKAKQLNAKTGMSAPLPGGGFGGSGKKYGGISSENFNNYKNTSTAYGGGAASDQVFGDGGGFDGSNNIVVPPAAADEFEEYVVAPTTSNAKAATNSQAQSSAPAEDDDDEFDDFQSAPPAPTQSKNADILDLFNAPAPSGTSQTATAPPKSMSLDSSLFSTPTTQAAPSAVPAAAAQPAAAPQAAPSAPKTDLFDSLWETSKTASFSTPKPTPTTKQEPAAAPAPQPAAAPQPQSQPQSQPQGQPQGQPQASSDGIEDLLSF